MRVYVGWILQPGTFRKQLATFRRLCAPDSSHGNPHTGKRRRGEEEKREGKGEGKEEEKKEKKEISAEEVKLFRGTMELIHDVRRNGLNLSLIHI